MTKCNSFVIHRMKDHTETVIFIVQIYIIAMAMRFMAFYYYYKIYRNIHANHETKQFETVVSVINDITLFRE